MWLTWGYTFTLNLGTCISCCVGACVRLRYYMWLLQFSYQVLITWDEHIWQRDLLLLELFIGLSRRQFRMKLILILHFRALSNSLSPRTKVKGYSQRRDWTVLTGFLHIYKPFIELFSDRPSQINVLLPWLKRPHLRQITWSAPLQVGWGWGRLVPLQQDQYTSQSQSWP